MPIVLGVYGVLLLVLVYVSSDVRIEKKMFNDDTPLGKIWNIQPKTYEYKDVINRGTKRVYGFIS